MSREVLKAVKDWCMGKFQTKGNYLTSVPEEYVTTQQLENFHPGGIRLGKDEEGNCGYYKYDEVAGADTFIPFSSVGGGVGGIEVISCVGYTSTSTSIGVNAVVTMQKEYKNILILCLYRRENKLKNFPGALSISENTANTYEIKEIYTQDNFSDNVFDYYKMLFCERSENGAVISLSFSLSLKQTDSASKNIKILIAGIY